MLDGSALTLNRKEFDLLLALATRPGEVVSKRQLLAGGVADAVGQRERRLHAPAHRERGGVRHLGSPNDIAAAADFLLGPHASFITGTDLLVDGGATALA